MPSYNKITKIIALAAITATASALPFKDNGDEILIAENQYSGDKEFVNKDMWAETKRHIMSKEQLTKMAEQHDNSAFEDGYLQSLFSDPDVVEAFGGEEKAKKYLNVMLAQPLMGNRPTNFEEAMGEGIEGGATVQNFAETSKEYNEMFEYPEEELEFWLEEIADSLKDEDPESADIIERIAFGDLSYFDAGIETSREATNEVLSNKEDVGNYFAQAELDLEDEEKIQQAYEALLKTPEIEYIAGMNSEIKDILRDQEAFANAAKASLKMQKESTLSAMQ